jgi:transposase
MKNQSNQLDFTGQAFFIGLDVHKKHWKVRIRWKHKELKRFTMNPSPQELAAYLSRHYPGGTYYSVYEAGFCGFWIDRELTALGIKDLVTNPADVPPSHKEKINKSDKIDAGKLSRELENHSLEGIYIPAEYHQQLRSLSRLRRRQSQHLVRLKCRIKSYLHFIGIQIPSQQHQAGADCLRLSIKALEAERKQLAETIRLLRHHIRSSEAKALIFDYLCSVPGIGFMTAVTLYVELIDIYRFPTLDPLCAFVGIVPSITSSDETVNNRGLTPRCNRYLRYLLVEAAWVAIRTDPALSMKFAELSKRMSEQEAIIRIAKKLLNRIRYVWKNQTPYQKGIIQ